MILKCTKCHKEKGDTDFHWRTGSGSKKHRMSWCRDCHKEYCIKYREVNQEKIRVKQREWSKIRKIIQADKILTRQMVVSAVRQGVIKKLPCKNCGDIKTHGHHPDYDKPLEVMWLCKKHHYEIHRKTANQQ